MKGFVVVDKGFVDIEIDYYTGRAEDRGTSSGGRARGVPLVGSGQEGAGQSHRGHRGRCQVVSWAGEGSERGSGRGSI